MVTNHIICKIIENIASTNSYGIQKFLSNQSEVVNSIWSCYSHSANNEQLRIVSLKAICMLASHSINIFLTLIEKVGVEPILECLSTNNSQIQQSMLTMLAMLSNESSLKNIPEKVRFFKNYLKFKIENILNIFKIETNNKIGQYLR